MAKREVRASGTTRMQVEYRPIDGLLEDPGNLRSHPERNIEAIAGSLTQHGQQKPIVVGRDGVVIAGNGTLQAARALGWTEVAVVVSDLQGARAIAFGIADNRTAELAMWRDELGDVLSKLRDEGVDALATGYTDDEIDDLLLMSSDVEPDDDGRFGEFPEAPDDGFVGFKFGDYGGRVSREVYVGFVERLKSEQKKSGSLALDDVLQGWLDV